MLSRTGVDVEGHVKSLKPEWRSFLTDAFCVIAPPVRRLRAQRDEYARELGHTMSTATQPGRPPGSVVDEQSSPQGEHAIDVRELLEKLSVEELADAADEYFRKNLDGIDYYFAKPFTTVDEAPDYLICFAQVLAGVRPVPGMRVLDFGAGTGWTSRALAQLGCEVIVCDVSATALDVARQLFTRQPLAGAKPCPQFLQFDGHRFDLDDESVDRIVCIDAFHHVPNPAHVLREMGRVLKPGGVAGFQEPGPNHSKTSQSQFEMRNFTVVENDIVMHDVEKWANDAGFTHLELAVFTAESFRVPLGAYDDFLQQGATLERWYRHARPFVNERRIFFLSKGARATSDSRERRGLLADLEVDVAVTSITPGGRLRGTAFARNTGTTIWLPSTAPLGPVQLGLHLYDAQQTLLDLDYARVPMPSTVGTGVAPGESVHIAFEVPMPTSGEYFVEFDLVAEGVCWFQSNGSPTRVVPVSIE
jgi:2-polyprenyl-3-methyl-5-hydroxy-6-metoxy-1,4-benzoquinol methylase